MDVLSSISNRKTDGVSFHKKMLLNDLLKKTYWICSKFYKYFVFDFRMTNLC